MIINVVFVHLQSPGLTLLRGYYVHNQEKRQGKPWKFSFFNRFKRWNQIVRAVFAWGGKADPAKSRDEVVANDPIKAEISEVYLAWYAGLQQARRKVKDVIMEASRPGNEELERVLLEYCGDRSGKVSARRLGKWLARYVNRKVGGLVLRQGTKTEHTFYWYMECYDSKLLPPSPKANRLATKQADPDEFVLGLGGKTKI